MSHDLFGILPVGCGRQNKFSAGRRFQFEKGQECFAVRQARNIDVDTLGNRPFHVSATAAEP